MFDVCGQGEAVSLAQVLDGLLAELRPRSGLVQQLCAGAITRAFAAVAQLPNTRVSSDISTGINTSPDDPAIEDVNDPLIGRWGFSLVLLYLRRYIELLVILDHIDPSCERYMQQDEFIAVLPKVQQVCGVVVESPAAEFEQLNDGSGEISFDTFSHWVLNQNLEQFAADDEAAAEEAAVQRVVGIPMGQVNTLTFGEGATRRTLCQNCQNCQWLPSRRLRDSQRCPKRRNVVCSAMPSLHRICHMCNTDSLMHRDW